MQISVPPQSRPPSRKFPSPCSGHKQITLANFFKSPSSLENAYKNLNKSKSYAHYSLFKAEFTFLNHFFNRILLKISFPKGKIDLKSTKFGPVVHIKINKSLHYMHFRAKMIVKVHFRTFTKPIPVCHFYVTTSPENEISDLNKRNQNVQKTRRLAATFPTNLRAP